MHNKCCKKHLSIHVDPSPIYDWIGQYTSIIKVMHAFEVYEVFDSTFVAYFVCITFNAINKPLWKFCFSHKSHLGSLQRSIQLHPCYKDILLSEDCEMVTNMYWELFFEKIWDITLFSSLVIILAKIHFDKAVQLYEDFGVIRASFLKVLSEFNDGSAVKHIIVRWRRVHYQVIGDVFINDPRNIPNPVPQNSACHRRAPTKKRL